jgi:pyruvate dehydrogenase E2 component (dihydrolipoamide acetyltransferase)
MCLFKAVGSGSGLYGSVTTADLGKVPAAGALAAATPVAAPSGTYVDLPVSSIRAVIAKRLQQSKQVWLCNYVIMVYNSM